MNILKYTLLFSIILLLTFSCTPYYSPNGHNVPLFKKKNEARISASVSTAAQPGGEIQTAYAVNNNIAIMFNTVISSVSEEGRKFNFYEFGAGYFNPLNKYIVIEVYGGASLGLVRNNFYYTDPLEPINSDQKRSFIDVNFYKYWFQPSIGFSSNFVDLALSLRIASLNFSNPQYNKSLFDKVDDRNNDVVSKLLNNKNSLLIEPVFTTRIGYKSIKLQIQIGFSLNNTNPELHSISNLVIYNMGIYFSLFDLFNKENKDK